MIREHIHATPAVDYVFYDAQCGFCQGWVRRLALADRAGRFRFAPREGATYQAAIPAGVRSALPDSVVVKTWDGQILTRSAAGLHLLRRLGGAYGLAAMAGRCLPRVLRDAAYDCVAGNRHHLSISSVQHCPVPPPEVAARFDP